MKTIKQRAVEYTANQKVRFAWEYKMMLDAYFASASNILDELKTVMSVSEDKYLRENIQKMINYLEGKVLSFKIFA